MALRVGLTGGIGSGKSEVARRFAAHGALLVDSDHLAREVVAPDTPGFAAVVAAFGREVVASDGSLDRKKLADLVFSDVTARNKLNSIVHPLVAQRASELAAQADPDDVIVHDVPLLVENSLANNYDVVVVVQSSYPQRLARLKHRGMSEAETQARIAAQATDDQRAAVADYLISNDDDLVALYNQVDRVWQVLRAELFDHHGTVEHTPAF